MKAIARHATQLSYVTIHSKSTVTVTVYNSYHCYLKTALKKADCTDNWSTKLHSATHYYCSHHHRH